ncbi:hypothetical protein [Methanoculleus frigidifontis]|nr:hypothetical protein [Methanoculleus sp. FWC-SCC1]
MTRGGKSGRRMVIAFASTTIRAAFLLPYTTIAAMTVAGIS